MFTSILNSTATLSLTDALLCTGVSLGLGLMIAIVYILHGSHSKSFVVTLALLPAIVQVVIMMVNGNLGVGVAVLGAFSLVRFRSVPGSSKEIVILFFAMAIGLATGMGYLTFAAAICVILSGAFLLLTKTAFAAPAPAERKLKITIPEDLDYAGVFDDIFKEYTTRFRLEKIKTVSLGSLFELHYLIRLRDISKEKAMIDAIRTRNGNLNIICSAVTENREEL
ncbi:MAG: DUF4956 domain-containing protein [Oscillospiraceae bacterium]|nr:DUF4956 domain-containing protein [Oscillospiraceae bacterium]